MIYPIAANRALCDPTQIEAYTAMLFEHVEPGTHVVSVLGIGEKGTDREGKFRERKFVPLSAPSMISQHALRWAEWNTAAYIVPAVLHPAAEAAGDVTLDKIAQMTAIILDLDSGDIAAKQAFVTQRLGRPTMVVASGGVTDDGQAKVHLYWRLDEPSDEVDRVALLRKILAQKTGGDASFGRATQVVRIAGSVHAKNGNASLCRIVEASDSDYSLEDLAELIETMVPMPGIEPPRTALPELHIVNGMMDFSGAAGLERGDTIDDVLHRPVHEGGSDLTRWGEASKVFGFYISEARRGVITIETAMANADGWMQANMRPPWPDGRFEQEFRRLLSIDCQNKGPMPIETAVAATAPAVVGGVVALPFVWRHPHTIPPRRWVLGRWLLRNTVTAIVSPGGVGKSSLMATAMLSLATGNELLGKTVWNGAQRAWYWNLEDDGDELARQLHAAALHHGVTPESVGDRLWINSGPDGQQLCTALEENGKLSVLRPITEALIEQIKQWSIDVLVVDPFVSSHKVDENHNVYIDAITKEWAYIAKATGCAIGLVHHTKKLGGMRAGAESARGASSLVNAARSVLVLNRMTPEEGDHFKIPHGQEARYFNVQDDKHNRAPAEAAEWFQLVSVELGNGDSVGVVAPWQPPKPFDGINLRHLQQVQRLAYINEYRADWQSSPWIGEAVATVCGLNSEDDRKRIIAMVKTWIENGALRVYEKPVPQKSGGDKKKKHVGAPLDYAPPTENQLDDDPNL